MKSKINKIRPFNGKNYAIFSINSVQIPKFMKHFAVRIQSKINRIRHSPDSVQSSSLVGIISCHAIENLVSFGAISSVLTLF